MHCADCMFWFETMSQCRRNAPQPQRDHAMRSDTLWPKVDAQDWCGEYQPGYIDRQSMPMQAAMGATSGMGRGGSHASHLDGTDARI